MNLPAVRDGEFAAEATIRDKTVVVSLSGTADLNVKTQLDGFLAALHVQVHEAKATEVEVDVRKLEFMNSSCLKCLVTWISRLQEEPAPRQYRIAFMSGPAHFWQRRSLHALSCLATHLVSVRA